ncbi:MAG: SAM-dependent DNA methyltransferase, partial [Candidatus Brocadiae bacterium]|nr:SAM-dependent DNA methyltransferase [Candidatus Brocadiia bacterium]
LPESADIRQILNDICRVSQWVAEPVDDNRPESPWISGRPKSVKGVKRIVAPSGYQARAGCCTWLNGIYWLERVVDRSDGLVVMANCGEIGKKKVQGVQKAMEQVSVYPLLRGQDVCRWHAEPSHSIVLAQDETAPSSRAIAEDELRRSRPKTLEYFRFFEQQLRQRSGYRKYLTEKPFYAVYNAGSYVFAPWKVVWREQASVLTCAVIGPLDGRVVVPDHKLMLVPCESPEEAYFVCGMLSNTIACYIVASYALQTSTSTHVLNYVPVPRFDPSSALHQQTAEICKEGHTAAKNADTRRLSACKSQLDNLAAELWGLSKAELRDIQDSLADLTQ